MTDCLDVFDKNKMSKFFISGIGLIDETSFFDGYFNFGLAHGIVGSLIALSEAFSKKILISDLQNSINVLRDSYKKFEKNINEILIWPTKFSKEVFLKKKILVRLNLIITYQVGVMVI